MGHTHTSPLYHFVWSTKERRPWLNEEMNDRMWPYMGGIVREMNGAAIQIGGMPDHVHVLARLPQTISIADAMRTIKSNSSAWVHENFSERLFAWQTGYAAFTVSESNRERVTKYIAGQAEHHRKRDFRQEYLALLKRHGIEYDPRYVFD